MRRSQRLLLVPIALLLALGCGDSSSTGPTTNQAVVSAVIDGQALTATAVMTSESGDLVTISAAFPGGRLFELVVPVTGATTRSLGSGGLAATLSQDGVTYLGNGSIGNGSLVLTSSSRVRITGSFTFTLVEPQQQQATVSIANGQFDITL